MSKSQPATRKELKDFCLRRLRVPVPRPEDENTYSWNEETQTWDLVELPAAE